MEQLFLNYTKRYAVDKQNKIAKNLLHVKNNIIKKNESKIKYTQKKLVVIPVTKLMPGYLFYHITSNNISNEGDPILRYIPFVENADKHENIPYFTYTALQDPAISYDLQIQKYIFWNVFEKLNTSENEALLKMKRKNKIDAKIVKISSKTIDELLSYTSFEPIYIVQKWYEKFDDSEIAKNGSLLANFCVVCKLFCCKIHYRTNFTNKKA